MNVRKVAQYQIRVEGSCLSEQEAAELERAIQPLLEVESSILVLDLTAVQWIDWYGLNSIAGAADRIRSSGELVICGASDTVAALLGIMRLDKRIRLFANLEEACKSLQA